MLVLTLFAATACRKSVEGTYSNANGSIILELKSGGNASFTVMGEVEPCSYTSDKDQITLDCKDEQTVFTRHSDESLTGPSSGMFAMIGALKKSK